MKSVLFILFIFCIASCRNFRIKRQWNFPGGSDDRFGSNTNNFPNRPVSRPPINTPPPPPPNGNVDYPDIDSGESQKNITLPPPGTVVFQLPCDCQGTPEYNPVCGDDGRTYSNQGKLECAVRCGHSQMQFKAHFTSSSVCQGIATDDEVNCASNCIWPKRIKKLLFWTAIWFYFENKNIHKIIKM